MLRFTAVVLTEFSLYYPLLSSYHFRVDFLLRRLAISLYVAR